MIDKIIKSDLEPINKEVIWAKPLEDSYAFYMFYKGKWSPIKLVDDNGTDSTSDDKITDVIKRIKDLEAGGMIEDALAEYTEKLEQGDIVPKSSEISLTAENLQSWEERDALAVEDTWTNIVRTTAGDTSIVSDQGGKIISIVAATDFYAGSLTATGFNLLHYARAVSGNAYQIMVPQVSFGTFGTADKPNGILFTDSEGVNLKPTVYFKPLSAGVPASATDGTLATYVDSNGYRFYTAAQEGYFIISGITLNNTCAHIAWSRRYDEYIAWNASSDAGSTINLVPIIHNIHSYDLMLVVGSGSNLIADKIVFENDVATWYRCVERVQPTWTTTTNEVEEGQTQTYTHTATITGMKSGGIAECKGTSIVLSIDGNTVSYTDENSAATSVYVYYELATIVTGTYTASASYMLEDWGVEMLNDATGSAYITTQYAQGYPDSLAALASSLAAWKMQVLAEAIAKLKYELAALENVMRGNMYNITAKTIESEDGYYICGQPLFSMGAGASTIPPKATGCFYYDTTNKKLYVSKSVTNATADWQAV